jgi:hypothetical protein
MAEIRLLRNAALLRIINEFYTHLYVSKIVHSYTFLRPIFKFHEYRIIDLMMLRSRDMFAETPCTKSTGRAQKVKIVKNSNLFTNFLH